jgi:phenylacetic acid degradation operon negative regulatory protein
MMRESNAVPEEALLERPLSARSLVASLLLRSRPARMRGARLVQWCGLFGVAEGTTRVALSRMVERGELRTRDGVYELAGRVEGRQREQDWSLEPELRSWEGEWSIAVVEPGPRESSERAALRDAMRRLRYAPRREGMWTRPDNLPRGSAPPESWDVVDDQCVWWSGRPEDDPVALAEELFGGARWSERAATLTQRLTVVTRALADSGESSLAAGFVTGAAVLAHVRADPLLPSELAADATIGDTLRQAYRAYEGLFSDALRTWFRAR